MAWVIFKKNCSENIYCQRQHLEKDIEKNVRILKQNSYGIILVTKLVTKMQLSGKFAGLHNHFPLLHNPLIGGNTCTWEITKF